jgi:citrate lyase subunit beta/citryl-CoA lyase
MRLRSLLFVPGDRPERMQKALTTGADAIIVDLEDAVAPMAKAAARAHCAAFLRSATRHVPLFVRVNALSSGLSEADVAAILPASPDGLLLPKAAGAAAVRELASRLPAGLRVLPIATETPASVFGLGEYAAVAGQLLGLAWGVEDLSAAIGAQSAREADGAYTPPFEWLRSAVLFAAHAAGTAAIDTVYPALRDAAGLAAYAGRAARDGFTGMLAIHPDQVPVINAAFTPTAAQRAAAQRIVAAFAAQPGAGVLEVDGRMVDAPHLQAARRLLDRAG